MQLLRLSGTRRSSPPYGITLSEYTAARMSFVNSSMAFRLFQIWCDIGTRGYLAGL